MKGVVARGLDAADRKNAAVTIAGSAFVAARKRLFLTAGRGVPERCGRQPQLPGPIEFNFRRSVRFGK